MGGCRTRPPGGSSAGPSSLETGNTDQKHGGRFIKKGFIQKRVTENCNAEQSVHKENEVNESFVFPGEPTMEGKFNRLPSPLP